MSFYTGIDTSGSAPQPGWYRVEWDAQRGRKGDLKKAMQIHIMSLEPYKWGPFWFSSISECGAEELL